MTEPCGATPAGQDADASQAQRLRTDGLSATSESRPEATAPLTLFSDELFAHCNEVIIVHCGQQYRLRRTRNNKLILYK